ncbi:maleate cis-trans isomerase [Tsukamurella sp. 8F]|uniref:maleate cis-trans isomerase family protein n=1 Tax=unclassified Tsukamurella TaxID=2633480 RepID=UPI0023B93B8D|nr:MULTISPECIES: maleate cis-trans isomerase [unclassified Tsukamurella]MDF0531213.1 maleate cis-trans isomerase [Tsukamurella sp. 8J]MDF0588482.1 maleate cis-trans isomerase [Tsukamurella sp. 8F]
MSANPIRIGLVVPSSNVTVETEMPRILARHPEREFTFHASRMRMQKVSPEQLRAMNAQRERCVIELGDAGVDAMLYACLVAIMSTGPGEHHHVEAKIAEQLSEGGSDARVLSSAGALVDALADMGATRIAVVTPYQRPLAEQVMAYLEHEGLTVTEWRALEVADNAEVGRIPGERVMEAARSMDLADVDALVLSACVQMPSLDLVQAAEDEFGVPVITAATAGAYRILRAVGVTVDIPGAGSLLRADAVIETH